MKLLSLICFTALIFSTGVGQPAADHLRKWEDNKYSMFIHFGMYSALGGVWKGEKVSYGYSEQIQSHAQVFSDEYARTANYFIPDKWNADSIALLAKKAGMRSIVITSKHHDGFCMFKTATTDYNIVDATPFKRDVIKELSEACKRHGLSFGLYYSIIDWHYPQAYPISSHNADFITPEHHEFSKKQLRELLTNYGPISELWFDMGSQTFQQSSELRALVKQLQPDCLISGRIGNDQGDFCVMGDNEYPNYPIATPWQVPASMYDETWGYRSWQKHVNKEAKVREKLLSLVKTVSRGGNYLLNIGPKGDGSVVDFERDVLLDIGKWLSENGEAVYGTRPLATERISYGELATKGNKVYLYLFETPLNNRIIINGLLSRVNNIHPLTAPDQSLKFHQTGSTLTIDLPADFIGNEIVKTIVFDVEGAVLTKEKKVIELKPGLSLSVSNATPQYSFSGVDYYGSYRSTVQYSWNVRSSSNKKSAPVISYTAEEKGRDFILSINGKQVPISLTDGRELAITGEKIKWGDVYVVGEFEGMIGNLHGDPMKVDVNQPWSKKGWTKLNGGNSDLYDKLSDVFGNWYWHQEINAPAASNVLVQVPVNDGVSIFLNGTEFFTINNNSRDASRMTTVLLPLKPGSNKLLVKYFNRFGKQVKLGVLNTSPQVIYEKVLPQIEFEKGKTYNMTLQLPPGLPIHQNVDAPGITMKFK